MPIFVIETAVNCPATLSPQEQRALQIRYQNAARDPRGWNEETILVAGTQVCAWVHLKAGRDGTEKAWSIGPLGSDRSPAFLKRGRIEDDVVRDPRITEHHLPDLHIYEDQ